MFGTLVQRDAAWVKFESQGQSSTTQEEHDLSNRWDGRPWLKKTNRRKFTVGKNVAKVIGATSSDGFLVSFVFKAPSPSL